MRGRVWTSLLVMAVGIAAAAAVQEFSPPLGPLRIKPPMLCGVVVYYAMRREEAWAFVAAAWCGIVEDGLSGVPIASVAVFAASAAMLCRRVKPQMEEGPLSCAVCGAAVAPALAVAQYLALRISGGLSALPAWFAAARVSASAAAGFATALVAAWALRALDWVSANVGFDEEEGDGIGSA